MPSFRASMRAKSESSLRADEGRFGARRPLGGGAEYENGGVGSNRASTPRDVESIQFRHEERSPSARGGFDAIDMARIGGLTAEHIDRTGTAADIDPATLGVEKDIVCIRACRVAAAYLGTLT